MFRRFGYPVYGWDGYKGLASYLITTPTDGIYLRVDPRINTTDVEDTELMFGYAIDEDKFQKLIDEQLRKYKGKPYIDWYHQPPQNTLTWQYNEALEQAMCDLQRPVAVRDQYFNCCGEVDEEFFDRYPKEAKPFKYAGYGIDPAYFKRA